MSGDPSSAGGKKKSYPSGAAASSAAAASYDARRATSALSDAEVLAQASPSVTAYEGMLCRAQWQVFAQPEVVQEVTRGYQPEIQAPKVWANYNYAHALPHETEGQVWFLPSHYHPEMVMLWLGLLEYGRVIFSDWMNKSVKLRATQWNAATETYEPEERTLSLDDKLERFQKSLNGIFLRLTKMSDQECCDPRVTSQLQNLLHRDLGLNLKPGVEQPIAIHIPVPVVVVSGCADEHQRRVHLCLSQRVGTRMRFFSIPMIQVKSELFLDLPAAQIRTFISSKEDYLQALSCNISNLYQEIKEHLSEREHRFFSSLIPLFEPLEIEARLEREASLPRVVPTILTNRAEEQAYIESNKSLMVNLGGFLRQCRERWLIAIRHFDLADAIVKQDISAINEIQLLGDQRFGELMKLKQMYDLELPIFYRLLDQWRNLETVHLHMVKTFIHPGEEQRYNLVFLVKSLRGYLELIYPGVYMKSIAEEYSFRDVDEIQSTVEDILDPHLQPFSISGSHKKSQKRSLQTFEEFAAAISGEASPSPPRSKKEAIFLTKALFLGNYFAGLYFFIPQFNLEQLYIFKEVFMAQARHLAGYFGEEEPDHDFKAYEEALRAVNLSGEEPNDTRVSEALAKLFQISYRASPQAILINQFNQVVLNFSPLEALSSLLGKVIQILEGFPAWDERFHRVPHLELKIVLERFQRQLLEFIDAKKLDEVAWLFDEETSSSSYPAVFTKLSTSGSFPLYLALGMKSFTSLRVICENIQRASVERDRGISEQGDTCLHALFRNPFLSMEQKIQLLEILYARNSTLPRVWLTHENHAGRSILDEILEVEAPRNRAKWLERFLELGVDLIEGRVLHQVLRYADIDVFKMVVRKLQQVRLNRRVLNSAGLEMTPMMQALSEQDVAGNTALHVLFHQNNTDFMLNACDILLAQGSLTRSLVEIKNNQNQYFLHDSPILRKFQADYPAMFERVVNQIANVIPVSLAEFFMSGARLYPQDVILQYFMAGNFLSLRPLARYIKEAPLPYLTWIPASSQEASQPFLDDFSRKGDRLIRELLCYSPSVFSELGLSFPWPIELIPSLPRGNDISTIIYPIIQSTTKGFIFMPRLFEQRETTQVVVEDIANMTKHFFECILEGLKGVVSMATREAAEAMIQWITTQAQIFGIVWPPNLYHQLQAKSERLNETGLITERIFTAYYHPYLECFMKNFCFGVAINHEGELYALSDGMERYQRVGQNFRTWFTDLEAFFRQRQEIFPDLGVLVSPIQEVQAWFAEWHERNLPAVEAFARRAALTRPRVSEVGGFALHESTSRGGSASLDPCP